jgi:hypothetical protein
MSVLHYVEYYLIQTDNCNDLLCFESEPLFLDTVVIIIYEKK